jgi:hypothetical protein
MTLSPQSLVAEFSGFDVSIQGQALPGVLSPLSRALMRGANVISLLDENPAEGDRVIASLFSETQAEINEIGGNFNYVVAGAEPNWTTPMQYGGHFLELDRELIGSRRPAITLIGGAETYVDIVSDLAETFLIWNTATNDVNPEEVAKMTRATTLTQVTNFPELNIGGCK